MQSESYQQRYSTGRPNIQPQTPSGNVDLAGVGLLVAGAIGALAVSTVTQGPTIPLRRDRHCSSTFRELSNRATAAYEWSGYFSRCEQ
jgi:hypothetical protein